MMSKHGWTEGQSLGNRSSTHLGLSDADRLAASRVGVLFKDNNLGLGAKKKKDDLEHQRLGFDAFQGLLGRLNGKSSEELKQMEQKQEDKKLAMYARGRWGGMVFVRGDILVGSREFGTEEQKEEVKTVDTVETDAILEKKRLKDEKRQRKEARRIRREEKATRQASRKSKKEAMSEAVDSSDDDEVETTVSTTQHPLHTTNAPDEPVSSSSSESNSTTKKDKHLKRKRLSTTEAQLKTDQMLSTPKQSSQPIRNGRQILRGRNIQAKRMALADLKGLDEIFMRTG
jgi:Pin2-interacting protein X1